MALVYDDPFEFEPPLKKPRDFCNRTGAEWIAQAIEQYWNERGYVLQVELRQCLFHPAMRSARVDVRSDMVGGRPAQKKHPAIK